VISVLVFHRWIIPVMAGLVLMAAEASAADLPCPPKRYACWEVVTAVNLFGEPAVLAKAKACGWSVSEISAARKCLK
jgi:hypothetical protein